MKRKIMFIVITLMLFLPIGIANAACQAPSSGYSDTLTTLCNRVCEGTYSSGFNGCVNSCLSTNQKYESSCYCAGGTSGTNEALKCYGKNICKTYSNTEWCKTHNQGESVLSDDEILAQAQERANKNAYNTCRAICEENNEVANSTAAYYGYAGCVDACVDITEGSSCKNIDCFKSELCARAGYSTTRFCKSDYNTTQYNNIYDSTSSTTAYTFDIPSSSSGSTSTSSGSIDEDKDYMDTVKAENCYGFGDVIYFATLFVRIMQIAAPILLIIWASVDLLKSVIAGDEKRIIEKRKPVIQRFIAAILVFLVPWIVLSIVNSFDGNSAWLTCWKKYGLKDPHAGVVTYEETPATRQCQRVCINRDDEDKCVEDCYNDYKSGSTVCYNAMPANGSTKPSMIEAARAKCYQEFADNWITNYNK